MGITVTLRGGSGDMSKIVYDPNLNGKIATAQIEVDSDLVMGAYDILLGVNQTVDTIDINGAGSLTTHAITKIVSDDLRHSIDAEAVGTTGQSTYELMKELTITNGIKGVLRVKYDMKKNWVTYIGYGQIFVNNVAVGSVKEITGGGSDAYVTQSEDIDFGLLTAGDKIQLKTKVSQESTICYVENLRFYYADNTLVAVAVTGAD